MGDPLRLYGLNAVVMNAGDGIGEATARTLVRHGASVVAIDSNNSGVADIFKAVKGITGLAGSFTDPDELPALIESAASELGGIDILVNDFPTTVEKPTDATPEQVDAILQARSLLTTTACQAALSYLKNSPAGRIINMGFLRSCFTAGAAAAYRSAEEDLAELTHTIAMENGEHGINANYVQPGGVMTPDSREAFLRDKSLRDFCIRQSAARRLGEPVDVAKVVLFLASDDAVFVSGTGIAVDGGRVQN